MGFILKTILIAIIVVLAGGYAASRVPAWKQSVIERAIPVAKEQRLLEELAGHLATLETQTVSDAPISPAERIVAIAESRKLVNEIAQINNTKSSVAQSAFQRVIELFQPGSSSTPTPSPATCPPIP